MHENPICDPYIAQPQNGNIFLGFFFTFITLSYTNTRNPLVSKSISAYEILVIMLAFRIVVYEIPVIMLAFSMIV